MGRIVRCGGMKAVWAFYESQGEAFVKALNDMIVFDTVIFKNLNVDLFHGLRYN